MCLDTYPLQYLMDVVSVIDDVFRHLSLTILDGCSKAWLMMCLDTYPLQYLMDVVSVIDDVFRHLSLTILDGCSKRDWWYV